MMLPLPSLRTGCAVTLTFLSGCCLLGVTGVKAQDRVVMTNNMVVTGKIISVNDGAIVIDAATGTGSVKGSYNLGAVARVDMPAPAAFQTGMAAYQAGSWDKALADLKPLAEQFRGLPTDWARQAGTALGEIYIEKNDLPRAEAAFNDFRRFYAPDAATTLRLSVGYARIAYAKNNAAQAKQQLQAVAQIALKNPALVTKLDGAAYGQAFYLLGRIEEKQGNFQAALDNYLRTVTLFYQDAGVTAKAQGSADALRAAHKDVAAP